MTLQPKSAARDFDRQWSQVRGMLREEFGETAYSTWLAPLTLDGLEGERVLLSVPTRFLRDWVAAHYADRIRVLWRRVNPAVSGVALNVDAGDGQRRLPSAKAIPARRPTPVQAPLEARRSRRRATSAPRSIRAARSRTSSWASPTSWRSPRPSASPKWPRRRSTRCSSTAASASARPT